MIGRRVLALVAAVAAVGCSESDRDGPDGTILVVDNLGLAAIQVDGGQPTRFRPTPTLWGTVAYSADGDRIAYDTDEGIYVADADGSEARRVTGQPTQVVLNAKNPSWSPNGDRLVFDHGDSLYTISPEGGRAELLGRGSTPQWAPAAESSSRPTTTRTTSTPTSPSWPPTAGDGKVVARGDYFDVSPDGSSLAYSGPGGTDPRANNRAVYVVRLDGGERCLVTNNGYAPIWSPDGAYLAVTRITECGHAVCSGRIFVMQVEGGEARPISPVIGDPGGAIAWIE